jgi:hypothetical protein
MAINKDFFAPRETIMFNGHTVCDVRGITPDDLARIMMENAADVEHVFEILERDDTLKGISKDDPESVSGALKTHGKALFGTLVTKVPELVAKIIAVAADDAASWEHVKKNFVLPLQLETLTTVAKLTFVDSNGFRAFVGNVLALLGQGSPGSAEKLEHHNDGDGSET